MAAAGFGAPAIPGLVQDLKDPEGPVARHPLGRGELLGRLGGLAKEALPPLQAATASEHNAGTGNRSRATVTLVKEDGVWKLQQESWTGSESKP
jgi:hypothetical protein